MEVQLHVYSHGQTFWEWHQWHKAAKSRKRPGVGCSLEDSVIESPAVLRLVAACGFPDLLAAFPHFPSACELYHLYNLDPPRLLGPSACVSLLLVWISEPSGAVGCEEGDISSLPSLYAISFIYTDHYPVDGICGRPLALITPHFLKIGCVHVLS